MTDKIETNCLAVTVAHPAAADIPADYLVRVWGPANPTRLLAILLDKAGHCESCGLWVASYLQALGTDDHWVCEFEDRRPPRIKQPMAVIHERMLRRLPPPDVEQFTESKDASVPA